MWDKKMGLVTASKRFYFFVPHFFVLFLSSPPIIRNRSQVTIEMSQTSRARQRPDPGSVSGRFGFRFRWNEWEDKKMGDKKMGLVTPIQNAES